MKSLLELLKIWLFDPSTNEKNFIKFIKNYIKS